MPVKVSQTFWKVHPFSDAFLRKKKNHRQAAKGTNPFPQPSSLKTPLRCVGCPSALKFLGHQVTSGLNPPTCTRSLTDPTAGARPTQERGILPMRNKQRRSNC